MTISRVVATRVPIDIEEKIRRRADAQGQSMSEWVRAVLIRTVSPPKPVNTKARRAK
jgi:hypothetical protein